MNNTAAAHRSPGLTNGPYLFRWLIVGSALLLLAFNAPTLLQTHGLGFFAVVFTVLLARAVPVAAAREKPITFGSAFIFAGSLLLNGPAAGLGAIIAYGLHARLFQKGGRRYALFLGAQYALAALAAQFLFVSLTGRSGVPAGGSRDDLTAICASAVLFIAVNALLVSLGNLRTRYARRSYAEPVFRAQALSYGVSFPYAVLLICAYGAFGVAALPVLAALLLVCAHAVRMTIENRSLRRTLEAIEDLGKSSASELREEAPLQRFLALARDLVAYDRAIVWLQDDTSARMVARAAFPPGSGDSDVKLLSESEGIRFDSLLARALQRSDPMLLPHASESSRREPKGTDPQAADEESWILYPLIVQGRPIGVAQFVRSARRPFTRVEMDRLGTIVPEAAVAFEGARVRYLMHQYREMMERYQDMAQTDGLTGLYNHRRSQELLREEMSRSARYHHALSVLMIDVDFFKHYNDTYGHPQGDSLLRSIAQILQDAVRSTDYVGRYGGEEFIVILPETAGTAAYVLAERIRASIEAARFSAGEGWVVQKTVSIGGAAFPSDGSTPADLLQRADNALYRAKQTGKNRVTMAPRDEYLGTDHTQART